MKDTWTKADELALLELQDRKERVVQARLMPLKKLVIEEMPLESDTNTYVVINWLIENADAVRDALEPFDSGERPAKDGT